MLTVFMAAAELASSSPPSFNSSQFNATCQQYIFHSPQIFLPFLSHHAFPLHINHTPHFLSTPDRFCSPQFPPFSLHISLTHFIEHILSSDSETHWLKSGQGAQLSVDSATFLSNFGGKDLIFFNIELNKLNFEGDFDGFELCVALMVMDCLMK